MTSSSTVATVNSPKPLAIPERRRHNRELALAYAGAGVAILPVGSNKLPIGYAFDQLDTDISAEEREELRQDFLAEKGFEPFYIGSSRNPDVICEWFRQKPDLLFGVCGGVNNLMWLDIDIDAAKGKDGPAKIAKWLKDSGHAWPAGTPITLTRSCGQHVAFKSDGSFGNHEGAFSALNTNVRGRAGYVVAQGCVREDGARYTALDGTPMFLDAWRDGIISPVPDFVRAAIASGGSPGREAIGSGAVAEI